MCCPKVELGGQHIKGREECFLGAFICFTLHSLDSILSGDLGAPEQERVKSLSIFAFVIQVTTI